MGENVGAFLFLSLGMIVVTALILHHRRKTKELEMRGSDPQLGPEVDTLRDDLNDTRAQLAEMQERLDFTERLLAGGSSSQEDTSA
jgi:hypothetical protein